MITLGLHNLVRNDSATVKIKGATVKIKYDLHKQDVPDPMNDNKIMTMWYLYVPTTCVCYMNRTEEQVFEDFQECFERDFITFYAEQYVEKVLNKKEDK